METESRAKNVVLCDCAGHSRQVAMLPDMYGRSESGGVH
jgi:hypothetical protein